MAVVLALPAPAEGDPEEQLVACVDALAAQQPVELPGLRALRRASVLLAQGERLRALGLQALSDVDTRELYALDGAGSTSGWVQAQQVPGADRAQIRLARRLSALPITAEQLQAGTLALSAAQDIGRALSQVRPHLDRPDGMLDGLPAEQVLRAVILDGVIGWVTQARGGTPEQDPDMFMLTSELTAVAEAAQPAVRRLEAALVLLAQHIGAGAVLRAALSQLVDALLPLQHQQRSDRAHDEAGLTLARYHDRSGGSVRGELDDDLFELLDTVLNAEMATDPDNPADTSAAGDVRRANPTGPVTIEDLHTAVNAPRSLRRRRHDALKLALRRRLDSGALGVRDKALPHLVITTSLAALHGQPGALPARTAGGGLLPHTTVQRIVCDSRLTRVVLDARGHSVEVSHSLRTLTARERTALDVQWGGWCARGGCTRGPGSKLFPHHAEPWHATGTTSLAETVPLCDTDHHHIHEGHRTLRLKDGRLLGPDGWVHDPTPRE